MPTISKFIKTLVPSILKRCILVLKRKSVDKIRMNQLVKKISIKHPNLLSELKKKKQLKVVFLVIHGSTWKVDSVYRKMVMDNFFDPLILVCPYNQFGEERMLLDMHQTYELFRGKGFSVRKALKKDNTWIQLHELLPDLVVFTNSNDITRREYYLDAYSQYLCLYIPYYFMATNHAGTPEEELNIPMLNAMWRIYWPHRFIFEQFNIVSHVGEKISRLTGYPAIEGMIGPIVTERPNVWKNQDKKKKRIIYAPHHTISGDGVSLSTFLRLGQSMTEVAECYKEFVQWAFKPHPILKSKLYMHPEWGKEKTDKYFSFWSSQDYTQLEEGEYEDLFRQSDAIIHDCSSFIAEYAVTRKPALYLLNGLDRNLSFLNEFGRCAFQCYQTACKHEEISQFVLMVVEDRVELHRDNSTCFQEYLREFSGQEMPSDRIIRDIKSALNVNAS